MALQLLNVCFEKRGHLILKAHFSHDAAFVTQGHLISWDATGSEDTSLDLRVVEEGAQNEDEDRHACNAGAGSRLGAADVPGRGVRYLRLFDPLHYDKENSHSQQARVRKPAERILHCDEVSIPENNHACAKRCAKSCKTRTWDRHRRLAHDLDTDWDKLKQPTSESDIGRGPILRHEEGKHHDQKSDNEPWLPVRKRRINLFGRHSFGLVLSPQGCFASPSHAQAAGGPMK